LFHVSLFFLLSLGSSEQDRESVATGNEIEQIVSQTPGATGGAVLTANDGRVETAVGDLSADSPALSSACAILVDVAGLLAPSNAALRRLSVQQNDSSYSLVLAGPKLYVVKRGP
jgi:hypothetical protein